MAMLEADADGSEMGRDVFGDVVDFIEAAPALSQRACDLVHEHGPSETSGWLSALDPRGRRDDEKRCSPATDDLALGPADSNIVADDHELDLVRFLWMLRGILFLRKAKVEDITCVVPACICCASACMRRTASGGRAYLTMMTVLPGRIGYLSALDDGIKQGGRTPFRSPRGRWRGGPGWGWATRRRCRMRRLYARARGGGEQGAGGGAQGGRDAPVSIPSPAIAHTYDIIDNMGRRRRTHRRTQRAQARVQSPRRRSVEPLSGLASRHTQLRGARVSTGRGSPRDRASSPLSAVSSSICGLRLQRPCSDSTTRNSGALEKCLPAHRGGQLLGHARSQQGTHTVRTLERVMADGWWWYD